jgi:hypothetical protein
MAQVKIEEIVDHLEIKMRRALDETIKKHFLDTDIESKEVFKTFKRMVGMKCKTWEDVPDDCVEK